MDQFGFYFALGWEHIISLGALDHILFICVLGVIFLPASFRKLILLLTAFTIGHSITLALNIFQVIDFNSYVIELLIPLTIIITAVLNVFSLFKQKEAYYLKYAVALGFGLVHGLGYASSLRFMLQENQGIALPLLSFNLGLEAGQILIAILLLMLTYVWVKILKLKHIYWIRVVSAIAFMLALWMFFTRL